MLKFLCAIIFCLAITCNIFASSGGFIPNGQGHNIIFGDTDANGFSFTNINYISITNFCKLGPTTGTSDGYNPYLSLYSDSSHQYPRLILTSDGSIGMGSGLYEHDVWIGRDAASSNLLICGNFDATSNAPGMIIYSDVYIGDAATTQKNIKLSYSGNIIGNYGYISNFLYYGNGRYLTNLDLSSYGIAYSNWVNNTFLPTNTTNFIKKGVDTTDVIHLNNIEVTQLLKIKPDSGSFNTSNDVISAYQSSTDSYPMVKLTVDGTWGFGNGGNSDIDIWFGRLNGTNSRLIFTGSFDTSKNFQSAEFMSNLIIANSNLDNNVISLTTNGNITATRTVTCSNAILNTLSFIPRSSAPTPATQGLVYFSSTDKKLKCYDGNTWKNLYY